MGRTKIHPEAKDIENFFHRTQRGEKLCEGEASGQYLRNRLETAFKAGWEACEKRVKEALEN